MNQMQLDFIRETLYNAYDQQDWETVDRMCELIDKASVEAAKDELMEERSVS